MSPQFSVLLATYKNDDATFLCEALESLAIQTLPASEVVLVEDGPITQELEDTIHSFESRLPLKRISLEKNSGVGISAAYGMETCQHELVARMDADDICLPDRFEKQVRYMESHPEIDVLGGWIAEFATNTPNNTLLRKTPLMHEDIKKIMTWRNPINHVTVMFRKSAVINSGNYQQHKNVVDWMLWLRMLINNKRFENMPDIFVKVRTGDGLIQRRRGIQYFKSERWIASWLRKKRLITLPQYLKHILVRAFPRLLPISILKVIYKISRK